MDWTSCHPNRPPDKDYNELLADARNLFHQRMKKLFGNGDGQQAPESPEEVPDTMESEGQNALESEEQDADEDEDWNADQESEWEAEPYEDVESDVEDAEDALYEPETGGR